jgi:hypothetical protein
VYGLETLPKVITDCGDRASRRFVEFFYGKYKEQEHASGQCLTSKVKDSSLLT